MTSAQLVACWRFLEQIARMTTEEETKGGGTQEDHAETLNSLIEQARKITDIDPGHPKVYCAECGTDIEDCSCSDSVECQECEAEED